MKKRCLKTREFYDDYKNGPLKDPGETKEIREHIRSCASCRDFVLDKSLSPLLSAHFEESLPKPSASFFVHLSRKIEETARQKEQGLFSEILMSTSLKLVPAMAALLFFITTSTAWFYQGNPAKTDNYTLEEMVLFDEDEISTDTFLSEILTSEVQNER